MNRKLRILRSEKEIKYIPLDDTNWKVTDSIFCSRLPDVTKMKHGLLAGRWGMNKAGDPVSKNCKATLAHDGDTKADTIMPLGWIIIDGDDFDLSNVASRHLGILPLAHGTIVEVDTLKEKAMVGQMYAISDGIGSGLSKGDVYSVTFSGGGGHGAQATAKATSATAIEFIVLNGGEGYTSAPMLSLKRGDTAITVSSGGTVSILLAGDDVFLGGSNDAGRPTVRQLSNGKVGKIGHLITGETQWEWGQIPKGFVRIFMT